MSFTAPESGETDLNFVIDESAEGVEAAPKEERPEWPWKKAKKVAVMLSFSGKDYTGMQRNEGYKTIESDLMKAFRESGCIPPEWYENPSKGFFQRASRTDKGVSAAKMVVSLKMIHEPDTVEKINGFLPPAIRVQAVKRVTKNFNSKNNCDARTYLYYLPTFAFSPIEEIVNENFRMSEEVRLNVNRVLGSFRGPRYFHNYTSGKLPMEPSAQRYITEFEIGEPFIREGLEFAIIRVKGQSFMLHQIRKMIGMAIAVVRGHASSSVIEETWGLQRIDIPKAPGLGLLLEEVHYERYNKKFGKDGLHEPLTWDEVQDKVEKFKDEFIYSDIVKVEKTEKSMFQWMDYLCIHTFEPRHFEKGVKAPSPIETAYRKLESERKRKLISDDHQVED